MTPDLLPPRMAAKVAVAADGCWLWTGALASNGYGSVGHGGRIHSAHALAYRLLVGAVPDGLQLDHLCRERRCCNPTHLEPVTAAENVRRARILIIACPKGHAYDDANTRINKRGQRSCKECSREYVRLWRQRQTA